MALIRRKRQGRNAWREKLQSTTNGRVLIEVAEIWREFIEKVDRLGPQYPPQEMQADQARFSQKMCEIQTHYPDLSAGRLSYPYLAGRPLLQIVEGSDGATSLRPAPESAVAKLVHWQLHRESLAEAKRKYEAGDRKAFERLRRTQQVMWDYRTTKLPLRDTHPLKGNLHHRELWEFIISLDLHKQLSSEDWADFFEAFCPCGREHSAESLRRIRARILKSLERAAAETRTSI